MGGNSFLLKFNAVSSVAFGGVTSTYANLVASLPRRVRQIALANSLDASVTLSFDGGTTDHLVLLASQSYTLNLAEQDALVHATKALQIKSTGSDPGAGTIYASVLRVD